MEDVSYSMTASAGAFCPPETASFHHAALIDNIETNTTAVSLPTALDIS